MNTNPRCGQQVEACVGKTIKSVSSIPSDLNPHNDDTDGFILEFADGSKLTVSAMSDCSVGVVGVELSPSPASPEGQRQAALEGARQELRDERRASLGVDIASMNTYPL